MTFASIQSFFSSSPSSSGHGPAIQAEPPIANRKDALKAIVRVVHPVGATLKDICKNKKFSDERKVEKITELKKIYCTEVQKVLNRYKYFTRDDLNLLHSNLEKMDEEICSLRNTQDVNTRLKSLGVSDDVVSHLNGDSRRRLLAVLEAPRVDEVRRTEICEAISAAGAEPDMIETVLASLEDTYLNGSKDDGLESELFFNQYLSDKFIFDPNDPDGDCMFHGFAKSTGMEMIQVRQKLKEFIGKNKERLLQEADVRFDPETNDMTVWGGYEGDQNAFNEHYDLVGEHANSQDGWGTFRDARQLSWILDRPVHIYVHYNKDSSGTPIPIVLNSDIDGNRLAVNAKPICLLFNGDNHYDYLRPKE